MIVPAVALLLACTRVGEVSPEKLVSGAERIVRATALHRSLTDDAQIVFRVEQVVKGDTTPVELELLGQPATKDDFNEGVVPYQFVRSEGRRGNCFATTYHLGAEYLLFIKDRSGEQTVYWDPLAPVNEQVRGKDDPWVRWVAEEVARRFGVR
jgi:hypothetical protein